MTKKHKHIEPPFGFRDFYSKYPHGYSIYEALLEWVQQVNDLTDSVNNLSLVVTDINKQLKDIAQEQLLEWLEDGTLETLINETLLNSKLDKEVFDIYTNEREPLYNTLLSSSDIYEQNLQSLVSLNNQNIVRVATYNSGGGATSYTSLGLKHTFHNYSFDGYEQSKARIHVKQQACNFVGIQEFITKYNYTTEQILGDIFKYFGEYRTPLPIPNFLGGNVNVSNQMGSSTSGQFIANDSGIEKRGYVLSTYNFNGVDIHILNTHLSLDEATAISQISEIYNIIKTLNHVIIMGDFNIDLTPDSPQFALLLSNGFNHVNKGNYVTYVGGTSRAIDDIFYKGFTLVDSKMVVTPDNYSDHNMLIAELEVIV